MTFKTELANLITTTNSIPNPMKLRLAQAFGAGMNLKDENGDPRNATALELAGWMITMARNYAKGIEEKPVITPSDLEL